MISCRQGCWNAYNAERRRITAEYDAASKTVLQEKQNADSSANGEQDPLAQEREEERDQNANDAQAKLDVVLQEENEALAALDSQGLIARNAYRGANKTAYNLYKSGAYTRAEYDAKLAENKAEFVAIDKELEHQAGIVMDDAEDKEISLRNTMDEENDQSRVEEQIKREDIQKEQEAANLEAAHSQLDAVEARDAARQVAYNQWQTCRQGCPP